MFCFYISLRDCSYGHVRGRGLTQNIILDLESTPGCSMKLIKHREVNKMSDTFTITEISKISGLSVDTIRYYEKIRLLPQAKRKDNGHRFYSSSDKDIMSLITCMKKAGMSLNEMKPYLSLSKEGEVQFDSNLYNTLQSNKEKIEVQIKDMQIILEFINNKLKKGESFGKTSYVE